MKFVDNSYYVPPTYSIDPFTGENVTKDGYLVEKQSIEVQIKNQPFTPVYDENGTLIVGLYYNIRFKGHYTDEWDYYPYDPDNGHKTFSYSPTYQASQSDYTTIFLRPNVDISGGINLDIPLGGEVDFQMQALIGEVKKVYTGMLGLLWVTGEMDHNYVFTGKTSNWSSTQTFTFEENAQTSPNEPTTPEEPTPEVPTTEEPATPEEQTTDDTISEEPITPEEATTPDESTPEEPTTHDNESYSLEQIAVIFGVSAIVISVAALGTGLLVYFKIRKH